ncbi:unnamed protein product [Eretmochelys imbricata]
MRGKLQVTMQSSSAEVTMMELLLKLLPWGWLTSCSCTSVPPCNGIVTQCITAAQHWRMESSYDEKLV